MTKCKCSSNLVEVVAQGKLLEVPWGCGGGSDGLPQLVLAPPQVVGSNPRLQVVVPEHEGLQRASVHNGAHRCHLQVMKETCCDGF